MLKALKNAVEAITPLLDKDILLVAGAGKSGTTWLQRMMNTHPEIFCPGEGKFLHMLGGITQGLGAYNRKLHTANQVVYDNKGFYAEWSDRDFQAIVQFFIAMSWAKASGKDLSGVRYIGDKDTEYGTNITAWRDMALPGAKLIHAIRDGRDTAVSHMHHIARMQGTPMPTGSKLHAFISSYARDWAKDIVGFRNAYRDLPELYCEVRYEDLLAEPALHMTRIFDFLGVAKDADLVASVVEQNAFKKLSGGRERGSEDSSSFYRKGISGDWKNHFDRKSAQMFEKEAGSVLKELGYES
ncbi:MAG: sulfotransferase [Leptospirillia bacterium]